MGTTTQQIYHWRKSNPDKAQRLDERNAKRLEERKALIEALKIDAGCFDCGYKDYACALQFHHIDPTTKLTNVSKMYNRALKVIQEEIHKCILLCANCHSVRTWA